MEIQSAIILCTLFGVCGVLFGWGFRGLIIENPQMIKCKKCGHMIPDKYAHKFCPVCGEKDTGVFKI